MKFAKPPGARTLFLAPAGWLDQSAGSAPAKARNSRSFRFASRLHEARPRAPATGTGQRATTSSIVSSVVSRSTASSAGRSGAAARPASRASRSRISRKRLSIVTEIPFAINCLYLRRARSSALAVRKTLSGASGNTTVPMSRPSATSPGGRRKARWRPMRAVADRAVDGDLRSARGDRVRSRIVGSHVVALRAGSCPPTKATSSCGREVGQRLAPRRSRCRCAAPAAPRADTATPLSR